MPRGVVKYDNCWSVNPFRKVIKALDDKLAVDIFIVPVHDPLCLGAEQAEHIADMLMFRNNSGLLTYGQPPVWNVGLQAEPCFVTEQQVYPPKFLKP